MRKIGFIIVLLFLVNISLGYSAEKSPTEIVLGHEDMDAYPWVYPINNGSEVTYRGIDLEFMKLLEKKLNVKISVKAFPWVRALNMMENGAIDGAFASSYKKEREVHGVYPTVNGKDDKSKRIHTSGYSLYLLKGSNGEFDGKIFYNLYSDLGSGDVAAQRGFSIISSLKKFNISINDSTSDPNQIFTLLLNKRVAAAVLQTTRADHILQNSIELKYKIVKYKTDKEPFIEKPYYIMLSHQFVAKYPVFSKQFWAAVEEVRNSEEFIRKSNDFYKNQLRTAP